MAFRRSYLEKLARISMPMVISDYEGDREQELIDYFNMRVFATEALKISEGESFFTAQEDVDFINQELSRLVDKLNLRRLW